VGLLAGVPDREDRDVPALAALPAGGLQAGLAAGRDLVERGQLDALVGEDDEDADGRPWLGRPAGGGSRCAERECGREDGDDGED